MTYFKTPASAVPTTTLSETELCKRLDEVVSANLWEQDKDRGREHMMISVFRDGDIAHTLEDYSQIMCEINWPEIYRNISVALYSQHRVVEPSANIPRPEAMRTLVECHVRIAQEIIETFSEKVAEHVEEALERHDDMVSREGRPSE